MAARVDRDESGFLGGAVAVVAAVVVAVVVVVAAVVVAVASLHACQRESTEMNQVSLGGGWWRRWRRR